MFFTLLIRNRKTIGIMIIRRFSFGHGSMWQMYHPRRSSIHVQESRRIVVRGIGKMIMIDSSSNSKFKTSKIMFRTHGDMIGSSSQFFGRYNNGMLRRRGRCYHHGMTSRLKPFEMFLFVMIAMSSSWLFFGSTRMRCRCKYTAISLLSVQVLQVVVCCLDFKCM
jgi:hypothetical protein